MSANVQGWRCVPPQVSNHIREQDHDRLPENRWGQADAYALDGWLLKLLPIYGSLSPSCFRISWQRLSLISE